MSSAARIAARSRSSGAPSTTRRITSSVSSCIRGSVRSGRPGCQRSSSASASAATVARCASIRSPWNGGSTSRRWRRCASPLVSRIELGPTNGSSTVELAPPRSALRRRRVDALDRLGIGDQHHRRVRPQRAQRERLAVARRAAAQQVGRPHDPLDRLHGRRRRRPGREHASSREPSRLHRLRNRIRAAVVEAVVVGRPLEENELVERARAGRCRRIRGARPRPRGDRLQDRLPDHGQRRRRRGRRPGGLRQGPPRAAAASARASRCGRGC